MLVLGARALLLARLSVYAMAADGFNRAEYLLDISTPEM